MSLGDDADELLADAARLVGGEDAAAGLAALVVRYRDELAAEAAAPRWRSANRELARLRGALRALRLAAGGVAPGTLAFCGLPADLPLAPVLAAASAERGVAEGLARLRPLAAEFAAGGRKRLRRGPPARWRLALASAELLDRRRPGSVSGTRSGPLHHLVTLLHAAATGADDERGLANTCYRVGKIWRDRRLALAAAARLPGDHPDRADLLAEAEHLGRVLDQGQ